ncbi:hypothetical protein JZ751_020028 [Albula glossodonta]|uniref:Uncharacterized protein n=1 Tax=Albula glossodonta TaxID=121402 RepID=A0A8T2NME7_9TELE|nr:hypothetical protein JZ751_020028 [Albula glossodonta]
MQAYCGTEDSTVPPGNLGPKAHLSMPNRAQTDESSSGKQAVYTMHCAAPREKGLLGNTAGKYVYQPMTSVCQLPSTPVPVVPSDCSDTIHLSVSLTERFLRTAPCFLPPPCPESPKYCVISDLFVDDYIVKRINGKMCYVQRPPPPMPVPASAPAPALTPAPPQLPPPHHAPNHAPSHAPHIHTKQSPPAEKAKAPKMDHCSSPSSSEDSGINAVGLHYLESCDEDSEEDEEDEELSSDGESSPSSLGEQDECSLLSPSKSTVEIIEKIETTASVSWWIIVTLSPHHLHTLPRMDVPIGGI